MPASLVLYTNVVIGAGAVVLAYSLARLPSVAPFPFALLLAGAIATSLYKLTLPVAGGGATMTISYAVGFAALLTVGPHATALVVSVAIWTQATYRSGHPHPLALRKRLFSVAAGAITAEIGGAVLALAGGGPWRLDPESIAVPLAATAVVYFLVNSLLVAGAIALAMGQRLARVWHREFLWSGPSYFLSAAAVGIAAVSIHWKAYLLVSVAALVLGLTLLAYRAYLGRLLSEQQQLRIAKDYTQGILHSMSEMLLVVSAEGRVLTANAATCATLGYEHDDLVGRALADVLVPVDGRSTAEDLDHTVGTERAFRTRAGALVPVLWSSSPLTASGAGTRDSVCVGLDIRERKAAEKAAREQAERLRRHQDALAELAREKELHAGDFDAAARRITETGGRTLCAVRADLWLIDGEVLENVDSFAWPDSTHSRTGIVHLDVAPGLVQALGTERVVVVSGADPAERSWQLGAGPAGDVTVLHAPIRLDAATVGAISLSRPRPAQAWTIEEQQFAGSLADLASLALVARNRQRARDELQKAKEAAEAASVAKSAFLATMSHELRTPLNAIIGYAELVLEEAAASGATSQVPDVLKIERAGKHLLSLINDILDFSKIEAGMMDLHRETFDAASLVHDVVLTMEPLAAKNGNRVLVEVAADLGTVTADAIRVRQVLLNLLGNAAKFTENGHVGVHASRYVAAGRDWLLLRVSDSGIGMSPAQLKDLFREFHQGDTGITRRFGGTGLGLAITKRLTELMGGSIEVESEEGTGSTFTVRLPVTPVAAPADGAQPAGTRTSAA
jgi:PAS domain S-box-containing protein